MMRKLLVLTLPILFVTLVAPGLAFADPDHARGLTDLRLLSLITDDVFFATADLTLLLDPSSGGATHYGPYPSNSPDSGTCGNDWATDTFDRHFTVKHNADGTFTVIQQFKNGSFVTNVGFSPGACDLDEPDNTGGVVNNGIKGSMDGYFIIPLPTGTMQTSTDSSCVAGMPLAPCTTTDFINSHFTPACYPATCPVTTFFFRYNAGDQQLVEHEWKNASDDRGATHGDIRSMNVP
jgi:hypothetical protein